MNSEHEKPRVGDRVLLLGLPPGFLDDLPTEDQRAIQAMIGKTVTLAGWDESGAAELRFEDPCNPPTEHRSHTHSIWVAPEFIARVQDD